MKNKKGFTLVELLVVVIIISIVGAIGALSVVAIKNKAADDTFQKLEKQVEDLGTEIYSHEILFGDKTDPNAFYSVYKNGDDFYITLDELVNKKYISDIKSPYNGSALCDGYLVFKNNSDEEYEHEAYLSCSTKKSDGYDTATSGLSSVTISSIE